MDAHGSLNKTRREDHQHPTSLNCIWELWKDCIQGTEEQSLRQGKRKITMKGIGKSHQSVAQTSLGVTFNSNFTASSTTCCYTSTTSLIWVLEPWMLGTRLILQKVIYAPVSDHNSCVFRLRPLLRWVLTSFVHQRAPLSNNIFTKATFDKCVEVAHLKKII